MTNNIMLHMAKDLKRASSTHDAPIWAKLADYALKPTIARRNININRIGQLTKKGDTVVFPGKVLGVGAIPHDIQLFSFAISARAANKIIDSGGKLLNHSELIEKNPTGTGVVLLG